jgi:hypothetical protein
LSSHWRLFVQIKRQSSNASAVVSVVIPRRCRVMKAMEGEIDRLQGAIGNPGQIEAEEAQETERVLIGSEAQHWRTTPNGKNQKKNTTIL